MDENKIAEYRNIFQVSGIFLILIGAGIWSVVPVFLSSVISDIITFFASFPFWFLGIYFLWKFRKDINDLVKMLSVALLCIGGVELLIIAPITASYQCARIVDGLCMLGGFFYGIIGMGFILGAVALSIIRRIFLLLMRKKL